jgi:hypothetical protein
MQQTSILALGAVLTAGLALAPLPAITAKPDAPPEIIASRAAADKFGGALKEAIKQAIESDGLINAISICHDKASQIAADLSGQLGMLVGRTSLKLRNPANAPDNWELAVLKQFEARKAQGEPVDKLEFFAVIEDDKGHQNFRYMKAIPMNALCLNCHGENISAEIDAKLKDLYPNDAAHGFKEGDLRGAFTLAKPLQ